MACDPRVTTMATMLRATETEVLAALDAVGWLTKRQRKAIEGTPECAVIPATLDSPRFRAAYLEFCQHRRDAFPRENWTLIAARRKLAQLERLGHEEALRWVEFALDEGLKNIQQPFSRGVGRDSREEKSAVQSLREAGLL